LAAPRSSLETLLLGLWREALKLDSLGIDEEFAELGGDSLQAAQIVAGVRDLFALHKPLVELAGTPTVAALAKFICTHEIIPGQSQKIAAVYLLVENMSDSAVEAALRRDGGRSSDG
jgi:acyl carrier protein